MTVFLHGASGSSGPSRICTPDGRSVVDAHASDTEKALYPISGFGDAATKDVAKGKTFTGDGGIKMQGTGQMKGQFKTGTLPMSQYVGSVGFQIGFKPTLLVVEAANGRSESLDTFVYYDGVATGYDVYRGFSAQLFNCSVAYEESTGVCTVGGIFNISNAYTIVRWHAAE